MSSFYPENHFIRVALYLRLSDEDRNKLTPEEVSESIKNQEIMLRNYVYDYPNWQIVGIYNDEDWSGSDATRPEFNRMIQECQNGHIDIVLCKTQARFARDMELVEKYIHNLFHEWNVRFLTAIDRIDNTKKETKKTSQLMAMTDQWYLEDTSFNIRETLKAKRKNGQLTASFAPYGFLKDPENKNHLIIDLVASNIIKRIYDEYMKGHGLEKIAQGLNQDKILSPYEYKLLNGSRLKIPFLQEFANYKAIEKTGTYIITVSFTNRENHIIKNLVGLHRIIRNQESYHHKFDITVRTYSHTKTKLYYSEKANLDTCHFCEKDFILLQEDDVIPKGATVIVSYTKELDRTHTIEYQLELCLKKNRNHDRYEMTTMTNHINGIVKSEFTVQIRRKFKWSEQMIRKILTDEVYIGNLVQFKTTTVSYKNHTLIYNDENQRIRRENTHEPIIDVGVWYTVQKRLQEKSRSNKDGTIHAFSNKIFCASCHQVFCKCGKKDNHGFSYLCCKDKKEKWSNCNNQKYLKEEELHHLVLEKLNGLLAKFYDESDFIKLWNRMIDERDVLQDTRISLTQELQNIHKELQNKEVYFQRLYEDRIHETLSEKEFLMLLNKYKVDTSKLEQRAAIIKREMANIASKKRAKKREHDIFQKYRYIEKLSIEVVDIFIDKIFVGCYDEKTGTRNIKIVWNFTI